jgi:hypothetical protein
MQAVIGAFPKELLAKGRITDRFFNKEGHLLVPSPFPPCTLEDFSSYKADDREEYIEFLKSMLCLVPEKRKDALALLTSRWLLD